MYFFQLSSITTGVVAVGGLVLTLFPPTAPIGAATLISSSIVGAPGAAYGTGNSLSDQRNILEINPKCDDSLFNELHVQQRLMH